MVESEGKSAGPKGRNVFAEGELMSLDHPGEST